MAKEVVNRRVSVFIESGQAQQNYDKLIKKQQQLNAELARTTDQTRIKELNRELARLSEPLDRAAKKVRGELDPSLKELRNTVTRLKREMNTLDGNDPKLKALAETFRKAKQELAEMEVRVKGVDNSLDKLNRGAKSGKEGMAAFWGTLGGNLADRGISVLREAAGQMIQNVKEAAGVRRAFDRLNQPDLLDNLRAATKGTVNDLELMKRAVSANNFQIPLENMGTYLAFAQARARETGQSVDYLVDSIITGLGRKSPLILDNLGISASRLSEEFQRTGDFGGAAAKIINEEMAKMGPTIEDAGDKIDQLKAKWDNIITQAGEGWASILLNAEEFLIGQFGSTADKVAIELKKVNEKMARENENFRQFEIKVMEDYSKRYASADQAGREKIMAQVKAEIAYTEKEEAAARARGEENMVRNQQWKLGKWRDYLKQLQSGLMDNSANTLEAMEQELAILQQNLKNLDVSSAKFTETKAAIAKVQAEIDKATGKSAEEAQKKSEKASKALEDLRKKFKEFDEELRKTKLGQQYGEMFAAFFEINTKAQKDIAELETFLTKGIIDKKTYEARLKDIQFILESKRDELNKKFAEKPVKMSVQIDMNAVTAEDGLKAFNAVVDKLQPQLEKQLKDLSATFELDVLKAEPGRERLEAELKQLEFRKSQELANTELTEKEKEVIRERYRQQSAEMEKQFFFDSVQGYLDLANQSLSAFSAISSIFTQGENNRVAELESANAKKKKSFDKLLADNKISKQQYDKEIERLDAEVEKKKIATERKQFKRNQKMQMVQAAMNGAMAITSTIAAMPGPFDIATLGTFRAIQLALMVATTAAQVAFIGKQKPSFGRGGKLNGPSHEENKGMPVVNPRTNQVQAWVEGDEGIINKRSMRDRRRYTVTGTPSQIASSINGLHGGVQWASGATTRPVWRTQPMPRVNYGAVQQSYNRRMYADGGVMGKPSATDSTGSTDNMEMITELAGSVNRLNSVLEMLMQNGIPAYTLLSQQEAQAKRMNDIRTQATMRK